MVKTKAATTAVPIEVPQIDIRVLQIRLIGDSDLICHAWSEKAKKEMFDKQTGAAKQAKEFKKPTHDFWASLYILAGTPDYESPIAPDGMVFGFPSIGFKAAAVSACSSIAGMTKVLARSTFHIDDEFVRIDGDLLMREDMVRVGMGTADIRYRGAFRNWSTSFDVRFNARAITPAQIVNLFNVAGFGVGVGEWRPEKDGRNGLFHVATEKE